METYKQLNKQLVEKLQLLKQDVAQLTSEQTLLRGNFMDERAKRIEQKFAICNILANNFLEAVRDIDSDLNPLQLVINASNQKGYSYAYELPALTGKNNTNTRHSASSSRRASSVHHSLQRETVYVSPTTTTTANNSKERLNTSRRSNQLFNAFASLDNISEEGSANANAITSATLSYSDTIPNINATPLNASSSSAASNSPSASTTPSPQNSTNQSMRLSTPLTDVTNTSTSSDSSIETPKRLVHIEKRRGNYRSRTEESSVQMSRDHPFASSSYTTTVNLPMSTQDNICRDRNSDEHASCTNDLLSIAMTDLSLKFEELPSSTPRHNDEHQVMPPRTEATSSVIPKMSWHNAVEQSSEYSHDTGDTMQSGYNSSRPRRQCAPTSLIERSINCKLRNENATKKKCKKKPTFRRT